MPKCKGCGAEILWVKMNTGGNMPLDPDPQKFVVISSMVFGKEEQGHLLTGHTPHWATCPNADDFKKEKKE